MIKRGDKNGKVYRLQRRLQSLGFLSESVINTGKGMFGPSTQKAVINYFTSLANGDIEVEHWRALFPFEKALANFNGSYDWVHSMEGHAGKPYWPKGKSGVTIDPGVDLGYIDKSLFLEAFTPILSPKELEVCSLVIDKKLRGSEAAQELQENDYLRSVRVSREQAEDAFPIIAKSYWDRITTRFPIVASNNCIPSVQSAMLSLAYNRGPYNRNLKCLKEPLECGDWEQVASLIGAMQQDHQLDGIRKRRRQESKYITEELSK